jgi:hypothetical protein
MCPGQGIYGGDGGGSHSPDLENSRKIDLMFIIDCSGSMGNDIQAVKANIEHFVDELSQLLGEGEANFELDLRLGLLGQNTSWNWFWLDLEPGLSGFEEAMEKIKAERRDECTPQAMDYVVENASWGEDRKKFLAVLTDEKASTGYPCSSEQFSQLMEKIVAKGIALYFIGTPGNFQGHFGTISNFPATFVSEKLHQDRGAKLMDWLAKSVSQQNRVQGGQYQGPEDIFGTFDKVSRR